MARKQQAPYEPLESLRPENVMRAIKRGRSTNTHRTPERAVAIVNALRAGATRNAAAANAGMNRNTLWRWVNDDPVMAGLVEEAEGAAELRFVATITREAQTTWQAAAWWLERRRPTSYGRKDRMDVSVEARNLAEDYAATEGFDAATILAEAQRVLSSHRERSREEPEE